MPTRHSPGLPVEIDRNDDRMEMPEGVHPESNVPQHPVLAGFATEWPDMLGYNRFTAIRGQRCSRFAKPAIRRLSWIIVGDGRVACFASDLQPHWGSPRFQAWESYTDFWVSLMRWLAGRT